MSNMGSTLALVENHYRWELYKETWGHLAPSKNKTYRGTLTIAFGCYGSGYLNPTILAEDSLPCASPWWCNAVHDYLRHLVEVNKNKKEWDEGFVLKLNVTFRNFRFWHTGTQVLVQNEN